MATRKHCRIRTRRRKQRGGDGDGTEPVNNSNSIFKKIANKIKDWFAKPTTPDPTKKTTKNPALLSPAPSSSDKLPSNAVAINVKPSTPPTPSKPLIVGNPSESAPSQAVQVQTPSQGTPASSPLMVGVSPGSPAPVGIQTQTQPGMPPPISAMGGRRKKHRNTRRRLRNKRK